MVIMTRHATSRPRRALTLLAAMVSLLLALTLVMDAPAAEAKKKNKRFKQWASVSQAKITPGVQMVTSGSLCTANFVFTDKRNNVYVGYSAHCAGLGDATGTNGCDEDSVPLGTTVEFRTGAGTFSSGRLLARGKLRYSSWISMNEAGTRDSNTCEYNDFALVKLAKRDRRKVNPSVPFFGGPTGLDKNGTRAGEQVYSYGNSSLRQGATQLSPKFGSSLGSSGGGWSHTLYSVTPGVPGDSGSGFMSRNGRAVGTLSTVTIAPLAASNGLGDLKRELAFARKHSGIKGLRLTNGTRPFNPRV